MEVNQLKDAITTLNIKYNEIQQENIKLKKLIEQFRGKLKVHLLVDSIMLLCMMYSGKVW